MNKLSQQDIKYIYICTFEYKPDLYKIGHTKNINQRLKRLLYEYRSYGKPICKALSYGSKKDEKNIHRFLKTLGCKYEGCTISTELFYESEFIHILMENFNETRWADEALKMLKSYVESEIMC